MSDEKNSGARTRGSAPADPPIGSTAKISTGLSVRRSGLAPVMWHAVKTPDGWFVIDRLGELGHNVIHGLPEKVIAANARLMAAAPTMLDALRELRVLIEECEDGPVGTCLNIIDAAIAKAEGAW